MSITNNTDDQAVQYIPLAKLDLSPLNVRKTAANIDDLKSSIIAHGLMQNLSVYPGKKGKYLVFAGGRRLAALKALQKDGHYTANHTVPCQIYTEEQAQELSLVENTVRLAMHPADQFAAFTALIESGQTAEQVSVRFGCTTKLVEQRMKLARVAPELLAAYREEKLTLAMLEAFTMTDDHAKQLAVFEDLNDYDEPGDIRSRLTEEAVEADNKLVKFVTLESYTKAGGTTRTDLFGDEVFLENPELLHALVTEKQKLTHAQLEAEGWGWVQVDRERDWKVTQGCSRLQAEPVDAPAELIEQRDALETQLEEIEAALEDTESDELIEQQEAVGEKLDAIAEQIAAYTKYDSEQMKTAGAYAYIGHDGELDIERGLVRRQDAKKVAQEAAGATDEAEAAPKPKGLPESLKRDLEAYRLGVAQSEIAKHPAIAFDLLVFKAAKSVCSTDHTYDGPQVSFQRNYGGPASAEAREPLEQRMDAIEKTLSLDWQELDNELDQFLAFQQLTTEQKHAILAYCVASTLQPKLEELGREPTAYDVALAQTGGNVADYWRPTKENFLGRITKDQLLEMFREFAGDEAARERQGRKKSELVNELHQAIADPQRRHKSPEQLEKLKHWLPTGMAFGAAPEPKAVKVKKKKAA